MVFIPFVENAFKHSKIENLSEGWIRITLKSQSNTVSLIVENSKPKINSTKDQTGGIGIENVKRRLKLLYPGNHSLEIEQTETSYKVKLDLLVYENTLRVN
jgi:two-component system, LytTR family, sensor kinase